MKDKNVSSLEHATDKYYRGEDVSLIYGKSRKLVSLRPSHPST
jgi:hypothetical protein